MLYHYYNPMKPTPNSTQRVALCGTKSDNMLHYYMTVHSRRDAICAECERELLVIKAYLRLSYQPNYIMLETI